MQAFQQARNRIGRLLGRFNRGPVTQEKIDHWTEQASHGEAIERLMQTSDWGAVEEAQQVFMRLRDQALRAPSTPDAARHDAAVEWSALDGFFRELRVRVREGRAARERLAQAPKVQ